MQKMRFKINTAPTVEPISKAELKQHIRLTSGSLADNMTTEQSIAPGDHVVAAAYTLVGASIDVLGYDVLVNLNSGTNGSGGKVDVKLQDSEDETTWTDVTSGAFTQVTEANDNAIQEKAYTGPKHYLRVLSTVATATCDFAVDVVKYAIYSTEDDLLDTYIVSAREHIENICGPLVTQTWDSYLNAWPVVDFILLPKFRLQSVTSVVSTDPDDADTTLSSDDYIVDLVSDYGRIKMKSGKSYTSGDLKEINAIKVTAIYGYGDAGTDVPQNLRLAIKLLAAEWYENREPVIIGTTSSTLPWTIDAIVANYQDFGGLG